MIKNKNISIPLQFIGRILASNNGIAEAMTFKGKSVDSKAVKVSSEVLQRVQNGKEYDRVVLCAYIGIKSLMGDSKYLCTTHEEIKSLMVGAWNDEELKERLKDDAVRNVFQKHTTRKRFENILRLLVEQGYLKALIQYGRNTFLTDSLSDEDFVSAIANHVVEAKKKKALQKQIEHAARRAVNDSRREAIKSRVTQL